MGEIDPTDIEAAITEAREQILSASEMYFTAIEATIGYRQRCEDAGFSPTAAEVMSIEFHSAFVKATFGITS